MAVDAGVGPTDFGVKGDEIREVDFAGKGREDGDGFEVGAGGEPVAEGFANRV